MRRGLYRGLIALIPVLVLAGPTSPAAIAGERDTAPQSMNGISPSLASQTVRRADAEQTRVWVEAPRRAYLDERFTVRVETRNAAKGQAVTLLIRQSAAEQWTTAGFGVLNRRGVFQLRQRFTVPGTVQFRAVVKRGQGRKGAESKTRTTRLEVWETSVGAREVVGTMFYGPHDGFWHPELGEVDGWDLEDMIEEADPDGMDALSLGPTGSPEATRVIISARRLVPADGLDPESYLQQLFVYNPWTGRTERTIELGHGLEADDADPEISFAGGDGAVFAVTVQRGGGFTPHITQGVNMLTGEIVWTREGDVTSGNRVSADQWSEQAPFGEHSVVMVTSDAGAGCATTSLVTLETGTAVRSVQHGQNGYCNYRMIYDQGSLFYLGSSESPFSQVYDADTGVQVTSIFQQDEAGYPTWVAYDVVEGLLAGIHPDGKLEVTTIDGTSVWSIPAEQANDLEVQIVRLAENRLWVKTTDQFLRIDLADGTYKVVNQPVFPVAQIADHHTLYSNGILRRDRY